MATQPEVDVNEWEKLPDEELNDLLRKFFAEVRSKAGKEYSKSGMVNIRSGLNRHLQLPPHSRSINLMRDIKFNKANKVFKGKLRTNKRAGLHKVEHTKSMEPEEIDQCYDQYLVPNMYSSPQALQHKVFFDIQYYMARRGREGLREFTKDSFVVKKDHLGKEYVTMALDEATKRGQGDEAHDNDKDQDNIMYEQDSDRCPVKSFKFYLSKLNPLQTAFFQTPVRKAVSKVTVPWYQNGPVGKNKIGQFLPEISKLSNLNTVYTNHCLRATATNALVRGSHAPTSVTAVTGHKNIESLKVYLQRPTLKERKALGNTLTKYAAGDQDEPDPKAPMLVAVPESKTPAQVSVPDPKNAVQAVGQAQGNSMSVEGGQPKETQKGLIISGGNFHNCTIQLKL